MLRCMAAVFVALVFLYAGSTPARTNFSGTWQMDFERSESAHQAVPIGPVTLVIQQTAKDVRIETRRTDPGSAVARTEVLTYKLDGSETTMVGVDGVPVKSKAHWDGTKLVTETARNIQAASITTMNVLILDPKGRELTIQRTLTVQHGYEFKGAETTGRGTDVFIKRKTSAAR